MQLRYHSMNWNNPLPTKIGGLSLQTCPHE
jgi:hypothetical protein